VETTLLLAQLLLAAVFAVAGLAKLADRRGARQALIAFGLPLALARPGAWLLPLLELGVALALTPSVAPWWGALGALTLLLLFVGGLATTSRVAAPPSVTVSVNCTPRLLGGQPWSATWGWRSSPAWWSGTGRPSLAPGC